jgi:hypothetical protein
MKHLLFIPKRLSLGIGMSVWAALLLTGCGSSGKKAQTITFSSVPILYTFGTATVTATASSGLAVTYISTTTSVCTVNSRSGLVTDITAGTCIIAADQVGDSTYSAAAQVTQSIVASDNVKTYNVVTAFVEPDYQTAPIDNSVFTGAFTYDFSTSKPSSLYGALTEAMTQETSSGTTSEMTAVALSYQLSTTSDSNGGDLVATFALNTTNVFSGGGFTTGGTQYYGLGTATNPSSGGVGNAYVTIDLNLAAPETTLTAAQLDQLAYGDCTSLGMMMSYCMTGINNVINGVQTGGTMGGYPYSQTITENGSSSQTITFGTAPALASAGPGDGMTTTAKVTATANSGLAVTYSSLTPEVCYVFQSTGDVATYSHTTAGETCTIAADQYGNATFAPAGRATQTIILQ